MSVNIPKTICVDLDGTLIAEDVGRISTSLLLRSSVMKKISVLSKIVGGHLKFRHTLSQEINIDPSTLTYNQNLIDWLLEKKDCGHILVLASASQNDHVKSVFDYIGIFDNYHASSNNFHLIGKNKGQYLAHTYGLRQFLYCGNSWVDLGVWRYASHAVTVNVPYILRKMVSMNTEIVASF